MTNTYQSTSLVVMFKAFLDTDHVSEATGKTIAITISKNGGAFGNPNAGATNATEVSSGWYKFTADTTDTNTVGPLAYRGTNADIDDVGGVFYVIPVPATQASVDTIKAKTDNLPASPAATGDAMTLTSAYDFAKGTVAMTEAYSTDGAAPTPVQALFQLTQYNQDRAIASTTMTVKKLDGSTQAMVIDLDDATTPTSVSRSA